VATLDDLLNELVIANRILAREDVVDAYGHVSIRHPDNPDRYFISRSRSPALVERGDLMEMELDGTPVDQQGRRMYAERHIHGAIYETRPEVQSVVHNHSMPLIPFGVTGTPIRPLCHVGSGVGPEVPIWDIRTTFGNTNMLVTTMDQGRDLAKTLGSGRAALMRGHGAVVAGASLKEAVMVAIYLQVNAALQTEAMRMGDVTYLTPEEEALYCEVHFSPLSVDRAWEYFCSRAGFGQGQSG